MRPPVRRLTPLLGLGVMTWLALSVAHVAHAQVYVGHAADGGVVLSDRRSDATPELLVEAPPEPAPPIVSTEPRSAAPVAQSPLMGPVPKLPEQYRPLIHMVARTQRVSPALIAAIAAAESAFNVRARSPKGAAGMMQLMPATARRFNVANRYSAEESVRGGAAYLRWLSDHFDQDIEKTIAAYNAGEGAVERAGGIPPYAETQAYVPRVLHYMKHFARELQPALATARREPRV